MKFKKAQGEIITTVLIILLVLAAIVIVWQVVNSTVKKGGDAVTAQSECLGLAIELTEDTDGTIIVKPNKDIIGYRVYFNGVQQGTPAGNGTSIGTFTSTDSTYNPTVGVKVTSAGKIGSQWCNGLNELIASA